MIPRRLIRSVPEATDPQVEAWWAEACDLHPDWEHVTYRDPIDSTLFTTTSPYWSRCTSGAQLAGLVRLEALWRWGGFYIDSDVEVFRPFDPLLGATVVAGWEDPNVVPDAVLGAEAGHQLIGLCLTLALERLKSESADWRTGAGAWSTGPGVTTTILPGTEALLLPPGSFYPYHYGEKERRDADHRTEQPWAFCAHHWNSSWTQ